jgi:hypothetical protein
MYAVLSDSHGHFINVLLRDMKTPSRGFYYPSCNMRSFFFLKSWTWNFMFARSSLFSKGMRTIDLCGCLPLSKLLRLLSKRRQDELLLRNFLDRSKIYVETVKPVFAIFKEETALAQFDLWDSITYANRLHADILVISSFG